MRIIQLASATVLGLGVVVGVWGSVPPGARGLVDRKLEGVGGYNQAIDDAMNGNDGNKAPPAAAAPLPGAIKSGWITRKSRDGKDVRLYFAYPEGLTKAKPTAALIVLQEWWGVNDDMQARVKEFAGKGFYAVAPDLFNGKTTDDPAQALNLKNALTDAAAMTSMKTGLDLLQEEEKNGLVDDKRVGVIGWDMGAHQALLLSETDPRVKATAIFYGQLLVDYSKLNPVQGPVLAVFGNNDKSPTPAEVKKFQDALKSVGNSNLTLYQFDGVGHGFASKTSGAAYDEGKARDAMDKLYTWLDAKLPR